MNINKKLDRMKQWAGEKMGGEVKTGTSDDFKSLELEMNTRHEGMERLQRSMTVYAKSISTRNAGEERDKVLPIAFMGQSMVAHGQDFDHESEFGSCLVAMGRANENLARKQETYVAQANTTWLESLERSLAQLKEYQAARKKLEQRRLAYDTSLAKMQKVKKEDFRVEEELRSQKAKYEETSEDVYRRMLDIKESEAESVTDITAFLDAELAYYEGCRDILAKLRRDWPGTSAGAAGTSSRPSRPRSNTAHSFSDRTRGPPDLDEPRPALPARLPSRDHSYDRVSSSARPVYSRANTGGAIGDGGRDFSPARVSRMPSEPPAMVAGRLQLRPVRRGDTFTDEEQETSSPDRYFHERSESPATSYGSVGSRTASWSNMESGAVGSIKKAPPPPPPSRAKKPAPPPPPMKRSALSTSEIPQSPH